MALTNAEKDELGKLVRYGIAQGWGVSRIKALARLRGFKDRTTRAYYIALFPRCPVCHEADCQCGGKAP